jgi:hypothetical protein
MKKLLLATVLALGVADAAYASQFVTPWYDGQYFCTFTNAGGYFNVRFSNKVVEKPRTCKGDRCSTNGYEMKIYASMYLNLWNGKTYYADRVTSQPGYVQFYKDFREGRLHVKLYKPNGGKEIRGVYTDAKGKQFGLVCRKG